MKYRTIGADPPWPYPEGERQWDGRPEWTSPTLPYSTMSIADIEALPAGSLGVPDAHLYLWTTQRFIWTARDVAVAWGFTPQRVLTWCKKPMGKTSGGGFCNSTEFFLFCRKNPGPSLRMARLAKGLTAKEVCAELGAHGAINHGGAVVNWEAGLSLPPLPYLDRLKRLLSLGTDWDELAGPPVQCGSTWFEWPRGKHSAKPEHFYDLVEQVSPAPYLELFSRRHRMGWDVHGFESANTAQLTAPAPARAEATTK